MISSTAVLHHEHTRVSAELDRSKEFVTVYLTEEGSGTASLKLPVDTWIDVFKTVMNEVEIARNLGVDTLREMLGEVPNEDPS